MKPETSQQRIKWIFFDIGGVLRDESEYNIWRKDILLSQAKKIKPKISEEDFEDVVKQASKMHGSLRQNILEILTGDKELAEKIKNEIHAQGTKILQNMPIIPNALEVIKKLSKNYSLGIISNYSSDIKNVLRQAGLFGHFKVLGISEDYGLHKPDPAFFKAVLKDAKAKPEESAMIDDNIERSLDVAKQLGITTVFFNSTNRQDIPEDIVDFTICSLPDLLNIF
ncbi:MAG: HAD family hydrolase [Candidatus Pacebacteria bacterium]|nr:HAD family hydrolase [Candidatus Paceibacterota bacterium]